MAEYLSFLQPHRKSFQSQEDSSRSNPFFHPLNQPSLPTGQIRYQTLLYMHRFKLRTLINNLHFLYLADYLSLREISLNCSKVICKDLKHHCKVLALSTFLEQIDAFYYINQVNIIPYKPQIPQFTVVYCYKPELEDLTSPYQLTQQSYQQKNNYNVVCIFLLVKIQQQAEYNDLHKLQKVEKRMLKDMGLGINWILSQSNITITQKGKSKENEDPTQLQIKFSMILDSNQMRYSIASCRTGNMGHL